MLKFVFIYRNKLRDPAVFIIGTLHKYSATASFVPRFRYLNIEGIELSRYERNAR
jgi:hypothetical protein